MNKLLLIILFWVWFTVGFSQEHARVFFTDKPNVAASLANPVSILTQKAINRKNKFGIPIDETDVPVNESHISTLKQQQGITVLAKSKWFNMVHVVGNKRDIDALLALSFVSRIEFADRSLNSPPNQTSPLTRTQKLQASQITFNYGSSLNQVQMMNVDQLHQQDLTAEGITIGVMDSGFPGVNTIAAFQRLRDNSDLVGGFDFVSRNPNVFAFTANDHGTQVLSAMVAFVDGQLVGTAPDASYYLFRTEDAFSETPVEESYWVEAAERADSLGVDILNTSLGYSRFDDARYNYSPSDMNGQTAFITLGADKAFEKGMIVVNSAGNSGNDVNWQIVTAPADGFQVLAVGAVNATGTVATSSSRGPTADGRIKPDVVAQGVSTVLVNQTNQVINNSGTSFSAPLVTGAIASLWQANPTKTPAEIISIVKNSSSQAGSPDNSLGFGIPDFQQALQTLSLTDKFMDEARIFPNPADDFLQIQLPVSLSFEFALYDMLGRLQKVESATSSTHTVNLSQLSPGMYLAQLKTDGFQKTFKILLR